MWIRLKVSYLPCNSHKKIIYSRSICLAYQAIRNNDNEIIIAGGQESMTQAQHCSYIRGVRLGPIQFSDSLLSDGLTDAFNNVHMGKTGIKLNNFLNLILCPDHNFRYKFQNNDVFFH